MAFDYTLEQKKVIQLRNKNILVAAAAGSGKTAVLVERIISMITDKEHPVDIDRLLVVTFTNAAAAEMRERISLAISKKLEEEPEDENLQRQAILIHNAQITTIDSFCLFVIRNHFNEIGLDPGFRVADAGELKLLRQDILEQLLEDQFAKKEEAFLNCVETYGFTGNDSLLEEMILKLYDFSVSYPWPNKWLEQCKAELFIEDENEFENQKWYVFLSKYTRAIIEDALETLKLLSG
ncbi:MAG: UvrD-helicase domain-containing protein, partial [Clostridiales bacterium]|nr:UvrD-helicase domain-containing protein [Clostridiales bacterium]